MALIRGLLASYAERRAGALPTLVVFQYNPTEITRVLSATEPAPGASAGGAHSAPWPPPEAYSLTLELDATDGLERDGAVTNALGISPRIAAIELLMQPVGTSLLGSLLCRGASVPPGRVPRTLFIWGPARITPVRLTSLTIRETAFDEQLNPIHASADLAFSVLRPEDSDSADSLTRAAATLYQGAREGKALAQMEQHLEGLFR